MLIRTQEWDEKIRSVHGQFSDGIYLSYGKDLFKGGKLCTFPVLSRRTCELLGEPYPVAYRGAFIDYHLFDIFKRLKHVGHDRIRYLEEVVFEYLHYRIGKAAVDETYTKRGRFDADSIFMALIRARQVAAKSLKQALLRNQVTKYKPAQCKEVIPSTPLSALMTYSRRLLFDGELPWRRRIWLWFCGRYLSANGWLRPFVR